MSRVVNRVLSKSGTLHLPRRGRGHACEHPCEPESKPELGPEVGSEVGSEVGHRCDHKREPVRGAAAATVSVAQADGRDAEAGVPPSVRAACDALGEQLAAAAHRVDFPAVLRFSRDRAFILLNYFSGVEAPDLCRLRCEEVYWERTHLRLLSPHPVAIAARESRFCAHAALRSWLQLSGIEAGPVFRRVKANGRLGTEALSAGDLANAFWHAVLESRSSQG